MKEPCDHKHQRIDEHEDGHERLVQCYCLTCGALGIDLDAAIVAKMEMNKTRPPKHGKAF